MNLNYSYFTQFRMVHKRLNDGPRSFRFLEFRISGWIMSVNMEQRTPARLGGWYLLPLTWKSTFWIYFWIESWRWDSILMNWLGKTENFINLLLMICFNNWSFDPSLCLLFYRFQRSAILDLGAVNFTEGILKLN